MEAKATRRKAIPSISPDTLTIVGILRGLDTAAKIVTKEELRAAIGRDPTPFIQTAKRHCLRDYGMVIEWDRPAGGWRNMLGADNLLRRTDGITSLRRKARRESEKLSLVDFAALGDAQRVEACAVASVFGVVAQFATSSGVKRIEGAVQTASAAGLPLGRTLALFHDNGEKK